MKIGILFKSLFAAIECNFHAEEFLHSVFPMTRLLLIFAIAFTSCAQNPPQSASGKKLQMEVIDNGPMRPTTYLYREVN
jgi:hypothetical protein